jgi:hypothetical protein
MLERLIPFYKIYPSATAAGVKPVTVVIRNGFYCKVNSFKQFIHIKHTWNTELQWTFGMDPLWALGKGILYYFLGSESMSTIIQ